MDIRPAPPTRNRSDHPTIAVRDLTMAFGPVTALSKLSVAIPSGITGLVGANGAGKTTLMRILLGLQAPTSGFAEVLGIDVARDPVGVRRRIGWMPEGDCLPPDVTAADFVAHMARLAGLAARPARLRASETLFLVGLEEERFRMIGEFSTGMVQRVKLAQAIVHDPELVLLDEPASGLDPRGRHDMLALVRRLGDFGIDVLISSHVLGDITATASWVVLLDQGRLLRNGPARPDQQTGTVVAEVLGSAEAMSARLRADGTGVTVDGTRLVVGPGGPELEPRVVAAAAHTGAGLVRLSRQVATLEDEFLDAARHRNQSDPIGPPPAGPGVTSAQAGSGPPVPAPDRTGGGATATIDRGEIDHGGKGPR